VPILRDNERLLVTARVYVRPAATPLPVTPLPVMAVPVMAVQDSTAIVFGNRGEAIKVSVPEGAVPIRSAWLRK
jgi:hypothetical protein